MRKLFLLPLLLLCSCGKKTTDPVSASDRFTIVRSAGFAGILDSYLVKNNTLYGSDTTVPLSTTKYNLAKKLLTDYPDYLLLNPTTTNGCGGCIDEGVIYIHYLKNGSAYQWTTNEDTASVPTALRPYLEEVNQTLTALK